jgi:hypothetical protein
MRRITLPAAAIGFAAAIILHGTSAPSGRRLEEVRNILGPAAAIAMALVVLWLLRRDRLRANERFRRRLGPPPVRIAPTLKRLVRGGSQVTGGYPDPTPDAWPVVLDQEVRGEGRISRVSNGDYLFYSGAWQTVHGRARVVRNDDGAFMVWGARLADGRRVHCRRSTRPGAAGSGIWRRRSDDGHSWVVGEIWFEHDEVVFTDGVYRTPIALDSNPFERAMASQPDFIRALRDDSFAYSFNRELSVEAVCTLDGAIGWNPSRGEAAETTAKLRGFGENYADFKFGFPDPAPPATERDVIIEALAGAGWRFQTDDEYQRFERLAAEQARSERARSGPGHDTNAT